MSPLTATRLLKHAIPLVRTHGFTRETLAQSVLNLPSGSTPQTYTEPLSETAVSALFGEGDNARRTLISAWLQNGLESMKEAAAIPSIDAARTLPPGSDTPILKGLPTARDLLVARLRYNEPVLHHLSEAFALLGAHGLHVYDPLPALKHVGKIADQACLLTRDQSLQLEWYARRGSLAASYAASELHQLASPHSAISFLDDLLSSTSNFKTTLEEVSQYSSYIFKSWRSIAKSSGIV